MGISEKVTNEKVAFCQRCGVGQAEETGDGVAEDADHAHGRQLFIVKLMNV